MILGIDVVFIHVRNPEKMRQWYSDVLGLEIGFQADDSTWKEFILPQKDLATRFAHDHPEPSPSTIEKQPIMVSFRVDDISSAVTQLQRKGVDFYGEHKIRDVGPSLAATFQDPEGNWIQISQPKLNRKKTTS